MQATSKPHIDHRQSEEEICKELRLTTHASPFFPHLPLEIRELVYHEAIRDLRSKTVIKYGINRCGQPFVSKRASRHGAYALSSLRLSSKTLYYDTLVLFWCEAEAFVADYMLFLPRDIKKALGKKDYPSVFHKPVSRPRSFHDFAGLKQELTSGWFQNFFVELSDDEQRAPYANRVAELLTALSNRGIPRGRCVIRTIGIDSYYCVSSALASALKGLTDFELVQMLFWRDPYADHRSTPARSTPIYGDYRPNFHAHALFYDHDRLLCTQGFECTLGPVERSIVEVRRTSLQESFGEGAPERMLQLAYRPRAFVQACASGEPSSSAEMK